MITVIGNLKGGTGKSTVAFNLAIWVATRCNTRVAIYDLDPQATLSDALEIREEEAYRPVLKPEHDLAQLAKEDAKTEVIIDIGMSAMEAMKDAIRKADRVIVPVAPSQADVWSTQRFLKIVKECCGDKKLPQIQGFVNRADTHRAIRETGEAEEALEMLPGIEVLDVRLYQRTAYRRSFSEGLAVFELEPRSKAAKEIENLGNCIY